METNHLRHSDSKSARQARAASANMRAMNDTERAHVAKLVDSAKQRANDAAKRMGLSEEARTMVRQAAQDRVVAMLWVTTSGGSLSPLATAEQLAAAGLA